MGLNAFFAFVVVGGYGDLWQTGMGAIFWGAIGLFFAHAVSYPVLDDLQHSIKFTYWYHQWNWIIYRLNGIKKILALLSPIKTPLVMIGDLSSHGVLLGILGFFYYNRVVITSFSCRGAGFYCGDVLLWIIFSVMFILAASIPFRLILAASLVK